MTPLIVLDHACGRVEDDLGGAVVLLQANDRGILEIPFKVQDVGHVCTPPLVDRLIGVPNNAEVTV